MTSPISPPPVHGGARNELPAYVANGVSVSEFARCRSLRGSLFSAGTRASIRSDGSRRSRSRRIRSPATSSSEGVWLSDATYAVTVIDQAYDFADGGINEPLRIRRRAAAERGSKCSSSAAATNQAWSARRSPSSWMQTAILPLRRCSTLVTWTDARCVTSAIRLAKTSPAATAQPCGKARALSRPAA